MAADSAPLILHLLYHEIRPSSTSYAYALSTVEFEQHLAALAALSASPEQSIQPVLTFDDGHVSDLHHALPALERHAFAGRFFITAGWTGRQANYMSAAELRSLRAAGQVIGAHGLTHTLLTHCTAAQLQQELTTSRSILEDILGEPVTTMSLPGGRFNRQVLEACRSAGYTSVYTSQPRPEPVSTVAAPPQQIGRLNIRQGLPLASLLSFFDPHSSALAALARTQSLKETAQRLLGDRLYARLWALLNRQQTPGPDAAEATP